MKSKKPIMKPMMMEKTKVQQLAPIMLSILLVGVIPISANAENFQSADKLHATALRFLEEQTAKQRGQDAEISLGRLDRRLRLTQCSTEPFAFLAPGAKLQGKLSVGLRCTGKKPWTVYLPAQIKSFANVITAAHALPRGTQISDPDLMSTRLDVSRLRGGYFTMDKNVVGKILKKSMSAGQAFSAQYVEPALLVHRGDEVVILASIGGLQVRVKGKALKDAALGERLPVRNKNSKRIVEGTAIEAGVVSVQM